MEDKRVVNQWDKSSRVPGFYWDSSEGSYLMDSVPDIVEQAQDFRLRMVEDSEDIFSFYWMSCKTEFDSNSQGFDGANVDDSLKDISRPTCPADQKSDKLNSLPVSFENLSEQKHFILNMFLRNLRQFGEKSTWSGSSTNCPTQNSGNNVAKPEADASSYVKCSEEESELDGSSLCSSDSRTFNNHLDKYKYVKKLVVKRVKQCLKERGILKSGVHLHFGWHHDLIHRELNKEPAKTLRKKLRKSLGKTMPDKAQEDCSNSYHGYSKTLQLASAGACTSQMQRKVSIGTTQENSDICKDSGLQNHLNQTFSASVKKTVNQSPDKFIQGTRFLVDHFDHNDTGRAKGYFLTSFRYKNYQGLGKNFRDTLYCTHITAKLVNFHLGVPVEFIQPLSLNKPYSICDIEVTFLDANHCPGAVMILFRFPDGKSMLYAGGFRAHPKMESYPPFWNCDIHTVYLDTTYWRPFNDFPSQDEIIQNCVIISLSHVLDNSSSLIVIGSGSIGREKVILAIALALDCHIWATKEKQETLQSIGNSKILSRLTNDKFSARVHVLPERYIKPRSLANYLNTLEPTYKVVIGLRLTGWEHVEGEQNYSAYLKPKQLGNVYIYDATCSHAKAVLGEEFKTSTQASDPASRES
ncbi:DNA cross-link repair 1A protein-like isoform X2 [Macrobrachium rosenbergii]|uniref:DNA cross-link repair 1A protein-like isoform X2 n=1 Tax=Macrobrachium rosenbergii TaxID=79674 RepID=UPI0034D5A86F